MEWIIDGNCSIYGRLFPFFVQKCDMIERLMKKPSNEQKIIHYFWMKRKFVCQRHKKDVFYLSESPPPLVTKQYARSDHNYGFWSLLIIVVLFDILSTFFLQGSISTTVACVHACINHVGKQCSRKIAQKLKLLSSYIPK